MKAVARSVIEFADEQTFRRDVPELAVEWAAEPVGDPRIVLANDALAAQLGLDPAWLHTDDAAEVLAGNVVAPGSTPIAQAYAGHQFGNYSPRLGDGRALLLGEVLDRSGQRVDVQLKGSGPTPFARGGDGRATLGPMLREYVMGEAMHALGVPTSRMLAVLTTGETVRRSGPEPGAIVARVAASHLRVGSFQIAASTGDRDLLRRLVDHAIARHHPSAAEHDVPALGLLRAVVEAQADTVARWMEVGFVHGVLNTDNVTISGETIDYGPCAFLDAHRSGAVFSSIDHGGRYAYGRQPAIMTWNLARLAETLLPLVDDDADRAVERATEILGTFAPRLEQRWRSAMAVKLGLAERAMDLGEPDDDVDHAGSSDDEDADPVVELLDDLLMVMDRHGLDHTLTFRSLADTLRQGRPDAWLDVPRGRPVRIVDLTAGAGEGPRSGSTSHAGDADANLRDWWQRWIAAVDDGARTRDSVADAMDAVNPLNVPRNHAVEAALDAAAAGDLEPVRRLVAAVGRPYAPEPGDEIAQRPAPPDAAPHLTFCGT